MDLKAYLGHTRKCQLCNKVYQLRNEQSAKKTSYCFSFKETLEDDGKFNQYFFASCNTCAHFQAKNKS